MDLTGNISIRPGGIDDIMNFLVTEYIKGNLRDDNNNIDEYVNTLRAMIKENSEDEKFTNDMEIIPVKSIIIKIIFDYNI